MNRELEYATGRTYDAPQVLKIEILDSKTDDFGLIDGKALFVDHSRHIAATVDFFAFADTNEEIGKAVLRSYDSGEYSLKIYSHFVKG